MNIGAPATTAVIVTYNSRDTIGKTLDALQEGFRTGCVTCVVVDNASIDGTADYIASHYSWVHLIRSPQNLGYGRGCNMGLLGARSPFVLILNPDAVIPPDALQTLVDFMVANRQAGIAAPAIIEDAKHFQAAGLMTTPASLIKSVFGCPRAIPQRRSITPGGAAFRTPWVCGAVMLVRTDLFRSLGGFDPRFFLYFEETDLCRRATEAGSEIWAVGKAVAEHVGGASAKATGQALQSACIAEHYYRSRFYYLVKHFGWTRAVGAEGILRVAFFARYLKQRYSRHKTSVFSPAEKMPFLRFPAKPGRNQ
jgi:N-acetylglucosaminyl-diphospho-decaprenol L-rhamnosyltransferase